ncbi:MAG: FtsX-like permease family protein [Pseudomonadales bacterium]|nr:FtsX-like permease family protein [Pseudomonadales bacterium]
MMEFGPVIRALRHHKTGTLLAALQIAVSLAIIVNASFIIKQRADKISRPTGMDTDNIIVVSIRGVGENYDTVANITADLNLLRNLPGVVDAAPINQVPLSGSGSSTGLRTIADENVQAISTARYQTDEHSMNTLGVNLIRGRNFYPEEIEPFIPGKTERKTPAVIVVTQALADSLYPDDDALGKPVYWGDMSSSTIVGIIDHMQGSWVSWDGLDRNMIHPGIQADTFVRYIIRTEPGERDRLLPIIEERLTERNRQRVLRYIRTHEELIQRSYELDRVMARVLLIIISLLIAITALVIVGLASYFVSQRTRQIGTRRALGATRADIIRYFLLENWLITTLGAVAGCVLTVLVAYWLETSFELPRLDWRYPVAGVVVLWIISQAAAWVPAWRAAQIPPAIATRNV